MLLKTCKKCSLPKDLKLFGNDPKNKDKHAGTCKECVREYRHAIMDANRAKGLCYCGAPVTEGFKTCDRHQDDGRDAYHRFKKNSVALAKYRLSIRARNQELKLAAFDAYGGRACVCCGDKHTEFLTIDHIVPVSASKLKERRRSRVGERKRPEPKNHLDRGQGLYRWLRRNEYPSGFRVLCMNCNWARGKLGQCPHETERSALHTDAASVDASPANPTV